MSELFLTGMFRSGSTTLARALNAHPNISFASDPYLEIFKLLRSDLAEEIGQQTPFMRPLDDYYFSRQMLDLLEKVEGAPPHHDFSPSHWESLLPVLQKRCGVYSQNLVSRLDRIEGKTYQDVFTSGLQEIQDCYGSNSTSINGFKEVWAVEFIPFFLNCFPKGKAIILQRDPRAVCASKNKTEEKYPWIFLCRQWRKLAALSWHYAHTEEYSDRILSLNFEDFIASPKSTTEKICAFLGVEWHDNIANASTYKGGGGEDWKQNTSFGKGSASFEKSATDRWKEVLSEQECAYIEYMCGPEMRLHNYQTTHSNDKNTAEHWIDNSPRIKDEDQANWMRSLVPNDKEWLSSEMKKEKTRYDLLSLDTASTNEDDIKKCFLKTSVYHELF